MEPLHLRNGMVCLEGSCWQGLLESLQEKEERGYAMRTARMNRILGEMGKVRASIGILDRVFQMKESIVFSYKRDRSECTVRG